jgi:hypothetical protein
MPSVRELQAELRAKGLGVNNGMSKQQLVARLKKADNGGVEKVKKGRKKPKGPKKTKKEAKE